MFEAIMWLFTVPVLKLAIKIGVGLATSFLVIQVIRWSLQTKPRNPFEKDSRKPRKPYVHDQKQRDQVISQSFAKNKVPSDLDAIVIGSGIGGLTTAAIMAKSGKKVLVLEQHDQAGGCCHSFIDKGYEFDVGIHYIGEMNTQTINKTLCDQITQGQLEWEPLDDEFDVVSIGYGEDNRRYPITTGMEKWRKLMKEQFPGEEAAIDEYFQLVKGCDKSSAVHGVLKLVPLWLSKLAVKAGLLSLFTNLYKKEYTGSTADLVNSLTNNRDLRTLFTYCWGDYGTPPSKSNFKMQALLSKHFSNGGAYPIGGASEIAYNIIPVIEEAGGKVLVRANVTGITQFGSRVSGVIVKKGSEETQIFAPMIISSAGLYNTFLTLLPKELAAKSYYTEMARSLTPGIAAMSVFLGLDTSNEELKKLNVKKQNIWAFTTNDSDQVAMEYFDSTREQVMDKEVPLLFISFPSLKDPEWKNHPGREGKSTVAIVTLANWDWFKQWEDKTVKKRGDEYRELKDRIGYQMIEQTCKIFPQIRNKIDYTEIGSPVTNKYYLSAPHGEIYGLDHAQERFDPIVMAKLRPKTDIPGLYLTGQDILSCGFTGALFAGAIAAQACLGRGVMTDLANLHTRIVKEQKSKSQ